MSWQVKSESGEDADLHDEGETLSDVELDDDSPDNPATWASHKITCQFTKAKRNKNKWACELTAGVMHLYGQDIVFKEADAELQF